MLAYILIQLFVYSKT